MFFEQYDHEPAIALARFLKTYSTKPGIWEPQRDHLAKRGVKALAALELGLPDRAWLAGETMTVADIALSRTRTRRRGRLLARARIQRSARGLPRRRRSPVMYDHERDTRTNASRSTPSSSSAWAPTSSPARRCSSSRTSGTRDLARALARASYKAGAWSVHVLYGDSHVRKAMIELGPDEALTTRRSG